MACNHHSAKSVTSINKEVNKINAMAKEKGLSYGQQVAKETMMFSDLLFWKRYNEFQKKQNQRGLT